MYDSRQRFALIIWFGLPHLLMWLGTLVMHVLVGYSDYFSIVGLSLPLVIALLWGWEWRNSSMIISLLLLGMICDILGGVPLGLHSFIWVITYALLPRFTHDFSEDTPFISRLYSCAIVLGIMLFVDACLKSVYLLAVPSMFAYMLQWVMLVGFMPVLSLLMYYCKRTCYHKLWAYLPEDIRTGSGI